MATQPQIGVRFGLEVSDLDALSNLSMEAIKQAVTRGAFLVAEEIRRRWVLHAREAGVWDTGGYVRGIQQDARVELVREVAHLPEEGGAGFIQVVIDIVNTARHASVVEDGHAAFHLPSKIDWTRSASVKVAADGTRYITVPFRHAAPRTGEGITPGAESRMMPREVYNQARKLSFSTRQNAGRQFGPTGQFIAADKYNWGGRMKRTAEVGAAYRHPMGGLRSERRGESSVIGAGENPAWKTSKFAGMVRMGAPRHSVYMTFRILTEKSTGWNIPAQAGKGIARAVAREVSESQEVRDIFSIGIAEAMGAL